MGLADSTDEDFDWKRESRTDKRETLEMSVSNSAGKTIFPGWFTKNHADVVKKSMLALSR